MNFNLKNFHLKKVSGVPCHSNPYYVNEILKKELKFKGVVVSDWLEVIKLHTIHKVASTPKEAVRIAGSNY